MKVLAALAFVVFGACTGGTAAPTAEMSPGPTVPTASAPPSERVSATASGLSDETLIKLAKSSGIVGRLFPDREARIECVINGGGPAPGIQVRGMCETSVARDAAGTPTVVTFTEYWEAREFHYADEPGTGQLSHSWSFTVDGNGRVTFLAMSGNFPPQWVK